MTLSRRQILKGMACAPALALAARDASAARQGATVPGPSAAPGGFEFDVGKYETCLDNARWHPLSKGARTNVETYLSYKEQGGAWRGPDLIDGLQRGVKASFARLINADVSEIAYVNSTTAGETMFVGSLGLPGRGGNIVTDALHFEGSLYLYGALQKQGVEVRCIRPTRDWRIDAGEMARAIDRNTRLVAVSHVSFINGFRHDLAALCEVAHAHGALVYSDAVQAVGTMPVDVRALGVDAMGSASYKWLMGDFGLGFLYVRQDVIPRLKRIVYGYRQLDHFQYHAFPGDPPGSYPASWVQHDDASGFFEIGTYGNATLAALEYSLRGILDIGAETIQRHAKRLVDRLQAELPRMGYASMTPADANSSIATFFVKDMDAVRQRLQRAGVDVSLQQGRMRISPSIYNDDSDLDRLLEALK